MNFKLTFREDASELILRMLIWSVVSVLVTRTFLFVTGNPTIGRGQWHIAHVLFGGILMTVAMISTLVFDGSKLKGNIAILFGIGWGLFVDEIGKYLTRDNNYWFRPAVMIIYISFVILFLIYRYLKRLIPKNNETIFYSVLDRMEQIADDDLEKYEKKILENKLKQIISTEKNSSLKTMSYGILETLYKIRAKSDRESKEWSKQISKIFQISYNKFFRRKLVMIGLWGYSIYYAIDKLRDILMITTSSQKMMMIEKYYRDYDFFGKSDVYMIVGKMVFDVMASVLFLLGARYFWSKKRLRGIRFFKYGLYVSILLGSIFRFYFEQLGAITDLLISVGLLEILNEYNKNN